MKILIADDSKVMRQIVLRTMRQAGFGHHDFVEAADGAEALDKVAAEAPDLVLSDWNMPNKTGIDLLRDLRGSGNAGPVRLRHLGGLRGDARDRRGGRRDVPHRQAVHGRALRVEPSPECWAEARPMLPGSQGDQGPLRGAARPRRRDRGRPSRSTSASPSRWSRRTSTTTTTLRAVAVMDLALAARSGAAIALVPKGGAEAADGGPACCRRNLFDNAYGDLQRARRADRRRDGVAPAALQSTFAPGEPIPPHVLESSRRRSAPARTSTSTSPATASAGSSLVVGASERPADLRRRRGWPHVGWAADEYVDPAARPASPSAPSALRRTPPAPRPEPRGAARRASTSRSAPPSCTRARRCSWSPAPAPARPGC